jgi:glycosyltransferase involved in cell wall biosynthesis
MRILTIIDHLGPGGRQRTAQNYVVGFVEAGHEAAVLSVLEGGPRLSTLQDYGVPAFVGGPEPAAQAEAVRAAAAWRPEAVHLHSMGPPRPAVAEAVVSLLEQVTGRPPVLESSSFGKVDYGQRYAFTDVHLFKTRWVLWRWLQWSRPLRPRPLGVVVPNTVDTAAFYPAGEAEIAAFRERHGLPSHACVFGCVARPDPLKWPPVMFRAFGAVAARHPNAYLVAAGLAAEARSEIAALPPDVRRRIVEIPFQQGDDALRTCYSAFDAFLHACPIGESFGMVFIEALACGTPVVTLSTPAKHNSQLEVVGHERGGLIANDQAGMAEAMERMLTDADLRRRLARTGAEHVKAHYTLDQVIPALLRLFDLARAAPTRDALAETLAADPAFITGVTDGEIRALLANTIGRPSLRQRVLMRLVHIPSLFRAWWFLKGLKYRRDAPVPPEEVHVLSHVAPHSGSDA